jgi:hypothetical protein
MVLPCLIIAISDDKTNHGELGNSQERKTKAVNWWNPDICENQTPLRVESSVFCIRQLWLFGLALE